MKKQLNDEYRLIPEGETTVKITKVDEKDYAKYQKLTVTVEDETGATSRVNFNFVNDDGTSNDVAEGVYARMCRTALNDQTLDECNTNDLVGAFVDVEVVHNTGTNGGTFANIKKWLGPGTPFKTKSASRGAAKPTSSGTKKKTAAELLAEMRARKAAGQ